MQGLPGVALPRPRLGALQKRPLLFAALSASVLLACRSTNKQPDQVSATPTAPGSSAPGPASVPGGAEGGTTPGGGAPAPGQPAKPPVLQNAGLISSETTDTGVRLSWTAAVDEATPPAAMRYRIVASLQPNLTAAAADAAPLAGEVSGKTSVRLTGLAPDTSYYLNVVAINAAGLRVPYNQTLVHAAANTGALDKAAYAAQCAYRLGSLPAFSCMDGSIAPLSIQGVVVPEAVSSAQIRAWSLDGSRGVPTCDRPPLLDSGDPIGHCVPFSRFGRLQSRSPDGSPRQDVDTVFSCRHYRPTLSSMRWQGEEFGSYAKVPAFEDIAILQHSRTSGETCWFQMLREAPGSKASQRLYTATDGRRVPPPNEAALPPGAPSSALKAADFWLTPQQTAAFKCGECHDSGVWKHSPYIDQLTAADGTPLIPTNVLGYGAQPYSMLGAQVFGTWPKAQTITSTLTTDTQGKSCTSCHLLGNLRTCSLWLPRSIGTLATPNISTTGNAWPLNRWMPPPESGLTSLAAWQQSGHQAAAAHIQSCCTNPKVPGCVLTPLVTPPLPYLQP